MFELVYAGKGDIDVRVVHDSSALIVLYGQRFPLEAQGTPFQLSVFVLEELIRHTGVYHRAVSGKLRSDAFKLAVQLYCNERIVQHAFEDAEVTVLRHPLPGIVEVIGVGGGAERQAVDDGCRQFAWIMFPLLVCIAFDERLIERTPDLGDSLFFEILRFSNDVAGDFCFQEGRCFRGPEVLSVKSINSAQIDGHGIDIAHMGNEHLVLIAGEFSKLVDVFPYMRQRGMENMRAVTVAFYAGFLIQRGVAIAADMVSPVNDGDRFFQNCCNALGKCCTPEACADYDVLHRYLCV